MVKRKSSSAGKNTKKKLSGNSLRFFSSFDDLKLRVFLFLALIAIVFALVFFFGKNNTKSPTENYIEDGSRVPDASLNITLTEDAIRGKINSSRNSIIINLKNVSNVDGGLLFDFNYTLVLNRTHMCEIGFKFDGLYVDKFNQKILLYPNSREFRLKIQDAPKNYENSAIYSCVIE